MVKRIPNLILIFVLLIVALACVAPGVVTTPDPNFINTAIAQTQTAQPGIPITGLESLTPTMTTAPSATPFPTFTAVVIGTPQLSVSVDTICRTGPGDIYDRVGVLRAGEIADVVGRSADGNYWVIRNPDVTGGNCWIPAQNATLTGLSGIVPVFAVPPTPTPTNTRLPSFSFTPTRTLVPTSTPTRTPTRTPTPSFTPSSTPSPTFTATPTSTSMLSPTPTSTLTPPTPTASPTPSSTPTTTLTPSTLTATATSTSTLSPTPTSTLTSPTPTASPTATPTLSPTPTSTNTATPTPSFTPTSTPSPTSTATPTATLLPGFTASYSGLDSCTDTGSWVELALENTGGTTFESMNGLLNDTANATFLSLNSENFINRDGCSTLNTQPNLPPGVTHIVSLPAFQNDPSGHNLQVTISLCTNAAQGGICMTETINFTP